MVNRTRRRGGLVPLVQLNPPRGGPPAFYRLARRARIAQALGPQLGPFLQEVRVAAGEVVLVFAGPEWGRALEERREELRSRVARLLGRPGIELRIECTAADVLPWTPGDSGRKKTGPDREEEPRDRLSRLAKALLARDQE